MMARSVVEIDAPSELPEADRLLDFPHPRHTTELFGHERPWHAFQDAAQSGRLHHAWLLSGPAGIGKATFAYKIARILLAEGGAGDLGGEQSTRLIDNLSHPRLLVIRRFHDPKTKKFTTSIPVDEVRKLRPFVGKTAEADSWRVVLIDSANDLNNAAANALLKVLEEPPRKTVFLLVAPQPGRLLATIRSRCRTLTFEPPASGAFSKAVNQALMAREDGVQTSLSPDRAMHLEDVAQGSVGRALVLADQDGEVMIKRVNGLIASLPKLDWADVRSFAEDISGPGQDQKFQLATDLILGRIATLTKVQATGMGSDQDVALADRLIGTGMVASWAELWERGVHERAETLALNLDRKSLILSVFSGLAKAAS